MGTLEEGWHVAEGGGDCYGDFDVGAPFGVELPVGVERRGQHAPEKLRSNSIEHTFVNAFVAGALGQARKQ